MSMSPLLSQSDRNGVGTIVRALTAIPRAATWLIGAVIGSIVAGFVQGWRDGA